MFLFIFLSLSQAMAQYFLTTIRDRVDILKVSGTFVRGKTISVNSYRRVTYVHLKRTSDGKSFSLSAQEYQDLTTVQNQEKP